MNLSDYRFYLDRLLSLLEEDRTEAEKALGGDLLARYQRLLEREKDRLLREKKKTYE